MKSPSTSIAAILAGAALLGLLAGPAAAVARRNLFYAMPEDRLEAFRFAVSQDVTTQFSRLPPEAEPYDTVSLIEQLGSVRTASSGRLERTVTRVFRDASLGLVTRVSELTIEIDRGDGPRSWEVPGLIGKSVALRVKPSGELLDSHGWSHLYGAARGGDLVAEAFVFSVLRLPIHLPGKDEQVGSSFRMRVPVDPFLNRDFNWLLSFTRAEPPEGCSKRCVALDYEGEVRETSEDRHPARPMRLEGVGAVSGTIVLDGRKGRLRSHSWSVVWERTVRSVRENETVRGELTQTARLTGEITADNP